MDNANNGATQMAAAPDAHFIPSSDLLDLARFEVKMLRSIISDVHEVAHLASCVRVTMHIDRAMTMLDNVIMPKGPGA